MGKIAALLTPIRLLLDRLEIIAYIDCNDCMDEDMASITIRNLDESVKRKLRLRAAQHGRSMEEEARHILRAGVAEQPTPTNLYDAIRRHIDPIGGVDLDIAPRGPMPEPPRFDE
jgi:plasmid stability protein